MINTATPKVEAPSTCTAYIGLYLPETPESCSQHIVLITLLLTDNSYFLVLHIHTYMSRW